MIKRHFILLAVLILMLSACGKKPPEETLPVETTPETTVSAEPELEYVTAQVNGIPAVLSTLSRGDTVDVVNSFDSKHFIVKLDAGYGLVEKNLVRPEGEAEYESWTGYAYQNAQVYDNYRLTGNPAAILASNTSVQVLDDLGWCVLVDYDGNVGYMRQESLAKKSMEPGSGKKIPEQQGQDGGNIYLQSSGQVTLLSTLTPQEGTVSGKAKVLADNTQIVLGYFDRGDRIPVLKGSTGNENLTVYLDGLYAEISGAYTLADGGTAYDPWQGQSRQILSVYADYWMLGSPANRLNANTTVTVLYELENCYLVEVTGVTGYVEKENIVPVKEEAPRETIPAATQPEQTKPTEPAKPEKPNTPSPTVPTQPTEATTPTETTSPTEATTPTEPTEESSPTEATRPSEPPTEPSKPAEGDDGGKETTPTAPPEWTPPIL